MDKVTPKCPWCGKEMEPDRSYKSILAPGVGRMFWYSCYPCGSVSPRCDSPEAAYAAAMTRYDEPLKPLKLHEVTGSEEPCVYLESRRYPPIKACDCVISADCRNVDVMMIGTQDPWAVPISEYGRSWRCWARRPTDEERASTPWAQIDA